MGKPISNVKINCGASWNKHLRKFSKRIYNKRLRKNGKNIRRNYGS